MMASVSRAKKNWKMLRIRSRNPIKCLFADRLIYFLGILRSNQFCLFVCLFLISCEFYHQSESTNSFPKYQLRRSWVAWVRRMDKLKLKVKLNYTYYCIYFPERNRLNIKERFHWSVSWKKVKQFRLFTLAVGYTLFIGLLDYWLL